jgi:serine/threonine protein kinase
MAASTPIQAGILLSGKYKVGRELGRGGMASVFAADNIDIGKRVAIKLLAGHLATSQTVVERFLREARAVAKIRSPHICDVYDVGRLEDGTPFLVLELLEGESLYDAMVRDRQMSPPVTLAIILQLCRGLAKAHEVGIVHRDLKPENVFLTVDEDGNLLVKILDFGLAKFYDSPLEEVDDAPQGRRGKAPPRLTRDGAVFGTPAYMSPEQVRGQAAADTRADLWAVACIAYECFTGTTVWKTDEGVAMTFAQIATSPIPDPRAYRPDLPVSFTAWFQKALDRNIERRFQSVQQLADELVAAFDYATKAGGLDASLISQITRAARSLSDLDAPTVLVPRRQLMREREEQPVPLVRTSMPAPAPKPNEVAASEATPPSPKQEAERPALRANVEPPAAAAPGASASHETPGARPNPAAAPMPATPTPSSVAVHHPTLVHIEAGRSSRRRATMAVAGLAACALVVGAIAMSSGSTETVSQAERFGEVVSRMSTAPTPASSASAYAPAHPWLARVREVQTQLAKGDVDRATSSMKRLADEVRHPLPRNLLEHLQVAAQSKKSGNRCQLTGIGRPRMYDLLAPERRPVAASAPSVALGLGGALVAWTDSSDGSERMHAVGLDEALRDTAAPLVASTEANKVGEPRLVPMAQRFFAAYPEFVGVPGVYVRWLTQTGAAAGDAALASPPKTTVVDLDATRSPDGGLVVAWAEERDGGTSIAFRTYDKDGLPRAAAVRIVDHRGPSVGKVVRLQIEAKGDKLHTVYEYDRPGGQEIRHQAVSLEAAAPGVDAVAAGLPPGEHAMAREQVLSRQDELASSPALGCNNDGCYVAWHDASRGGGSVTFLDRTSAKSQWTKRLGPGSRRFTIGMAPNGQAQLAWYDGGKLVLAPLSLEGPGAESRIGKVTGEPPAASLAPGAQRGEWYAAWLDSEGLRSEPYVARVRCQ